MKIKRGAAKCFLLHHVRQTLRYPNPFFLGKFSVLLRQNTRKYDTYVKTDNEEKADFSAF